MTEKFRVWDIKNKEMIYPFKPDKYGYFTGFYFFEEETIIELKDCKDQYIINWYTGVNDKNNNEIYSNDILKCSAQNYIGRVWFERGSFMTDCEGFGDHPISQTNSDDFEVIGNTLQNAELLKV